ncbi:alkaline phosphatase family protein [Paraoerskovia marina]|uniref:alkaline phosphatase family protein n=1 Tax=Paraoerskovia marina TaxID=545619 RepID=UPI0009F4029B|nr:alkaline phosphatase family protein [Paraoerskovia marina]
MRSRVAVTVRDVRAAAWSLATTALGLWIGLAVVPGAGEASIAAVLVAAAVVAVGDALLRPFLRLVAPRTGAVGAIVLGSLAQVVVVLAALVALPGVDVGGVGPLLLVLVVASVVMALARWVIGANDQSYVVADVVRRADRQARRRGVEAHAARDSGLLVIQLDGVSRSTFDYAVQAGLVPRLAQWQERGSHTVESWWARVPSTTPASQAGLLHGSSRQIPAFRWWDRARGRLVVTNRPPDAALVEARLSTGDGLLAHGGAAVATMFSGDAQTALLVMSRAGRRGGLGPGQLFVHFFSSPFLLARALVGTVAETLKELYQGWVQAARGVRPRVSRLGWYPWLRGVTNVVLRDLIVSMVAEQMVRGTPTIFVDLVDYDEIAHHAGPLRPEALRALEGIDGVVGTLEAVVQSAPRDYRVVVLSDHGQALGETFEAVAGAPLVDVVRRLMAVDADLPAATSAARSTDESWGPVNTALSSFSRAPDGRTVVGPDRTRRERPSPDAHADEVVVVGSGNLGLVWFPGSATPLRGEDVRARWPRLVDGLVDQAGIGLVVTREAPREVLTGDEPAEVVVHGVGGRRELHSGVVHGTDPLAGWSTRAAADLDRAVTLDDAPDLLLVSSVDAAGLVHAFEGLVGSHGGLGGAQNDALLIRPVGLEVPDTLLEAVDGRRMLVGAESVHERLVAWQVELGLRPR